MSISHLNEVGSAEFVVQGSSFLAFGLSIPKADPGLRPQTDNRHVMAKECKKEGVRGLKRRALPLQERRKDFSPVEFGLKEEEALEEAGRCLGLRTCESCEICSLFCPDLCITRDEETGEVRIDLDYCKGCGICASVCPKGAIEMVLEEGM